MADKKTRKKILDELKGKQRKQPSVVRGAKKFGGFLKEKGKDYYEGYKEDRRLYREEFDKTYKAERTRIRNKRAKSAAIAKARRPERLRNNLSRMDFLGAGSMNALADYDTYLNQSYGFGSPVPPKPKKRKRSKIRR